MKNSIKYIIAIAVITLLFAIAQVVFVFPLNPCIAEAFPFWMVYFAAIGIAIFAINIGKDYMLFANSFGTKIELDKKKYIVPLVCFAIPVILFVLGNLATSPLFTWNILKNQIGEIKERDFAKDFPKQSIQSLPVIDENLALKLAEKKLGEKPELISQVKVTTPTIQLYKGKLVWVVPLEHSGLFKWLSHTEGTPGYIIVSATDQKDVTLVDNHKIKVQKEAYLHQDLKRVAQAKDLFQGLVDYSFELDEQGVPHWVVTTYKNKVLFSVPEATGAVIVNAETGKAQKYAIANIPEWVDRVQPELFIMHQINNHGKYIKGIFNFSQSNMYKTSEGASIVYNNGKCYLYTGITSISSDEGIVAFYLVDMKTKETFKYLISGATEKAAAMSAEGKVQNLGYKASFPIILNVNNEPTYFMTLRDKEDLIKQYAFVNVSDYTTVGTGETKESAYANYQKNNTSSKKQDNVENKKIQGTVKRIGTEVQNGQTIYKVVLKEMPEKIFVISSKDSEVLPVTNVEDIVELEYTETDSYILVANKLKNVTLGI